MTRLFKKRHFCSKNKNNPYSSRGLDTFESLLLDLDEKRKKIYNKNNDDLGGGVSLVRFGYSSSSNNLVPIIVKNKSMNVTKGDVTSNSTIEESKDINIIRPCYYKPVVLMVLLVLLVFFGRTAAIVCTSIVWYIVPAIGRERAVLILNKT